MLHVDIHIISTINPDMELIWISHHSSIGLIHLGLIGQFHYPSIVKIEEHHTIGENQVSESPEEQDQEFIEDLEALKHQAQLRGLPYDSCLLREDTVDATTERIFAVAPGEGHKPIGILSDKYFEEMYNPTKYPTGKFGLITGRKTKLTVHKYFNLTQMEGLQGILSTCWQLSMLLRVSR